MKAPKQQSTRQNPLPALRIAFIYAAVAGLWIFTSDHLLGLLVDDPRLLTRFATYKGLGFVAVTALMLYGLVRHALASRAAGMGPDRHGAEDPKAPVRRMTWPLLALLILIVLVVGSGVLVVRHQKQIFRQDELEKLSTVAQFKAQQMDAWVDTGIRQAEYAATKSILARTAESWLNAGCPADPRGSQLQGRMHDLQSAGHNHFVRLLDSQGTPRIIAGSPHTDAFSARMAMAAMEARDTLVKTEVRAQASPLVHLFTPLTVVRQGEEVSIGCIHLAMDADRALIPDLESSLRDTISAEILVVGIQDGVPTFLNPRLRENRTGTQYELLSHLTLGSAPQLISGSQHLGAVAWSRRLHWGVMATENMEVVFKATQRLAGYVVLLGAVFITTGGTLIAFWMRLQHNLYTQHQRRQALENQLLEKRLDYLSRFANDIVLLVDEGGRIKDANDRACTAYGYSRGEMLSMSIRDLRAPESLEDLPRQWEMATLQEASVFETRHRRRNGSTFPVEVSTRHVLMEGHYLKQSIIRDISERKANEDELKRINRLQALILENSAVGIALVRNNIYEWVNPRLAEMLGTDITQIPGTSTHAYTDESTCRLVDGKVAEGLAQRGIVELEYQVHRVDGHTFWCRLLARVVNPENPDEGTICFFEDITARKESEEALRQTQKLESLGVLAGGIAHDFNNLLTAILGNLNLAQQELLGEHRVHEYLANVEKTILKASDLTRQMLAYSGKGRFIVKPNSLNRIISEMSELLKVSIPKKVELVLDLTPDLPLVVSDAAQIQQVVMNLVTNAADAIGEEIGTIVIRSSSEELEPRQVPSGQPGKFLPAGPYVRLEVEDNGSGMTPEVMSRIFDPFFSTKMTGRGLGLSAMLGILLGHQAGIQIHSQPGKGTLFVLFFPATEALEESPTAESPSTSADSRGIRILLVDDEPLIRETAGLVLRSLGMEITLGSDGEEALELFGKGAFDLVVLDLTMPRMDGREAFRRIRQLKPGIPIIVCSGYSEQESLLDTQGNPPTTFLPKPYSIKNLERVIGEVLAARP